MAQYQTLRSVSDNHVFVVCRDGEFYSLPDHVRHRGRWQGMHRGEIEKLKPDYWLDIEDHGYSLVRCELAVFKPDVDADQLGRPGLGAVVLMARPEARDTPRLADP